MHAGLRRCRCREALPSHRTVDPSDPTVWQRLLAELTSAPGSLRGVVHLSSLDLAPFDAPEPVEADTRTV